MRVFRTAAAAGLVALAACQDGGTGPAKVADLTLEVTATPGEAHLLSTGDGGPAVGCTFVYSFNPVGDPGATAAWTGGTLRFFVGPDRTTPFDSLTLTAQEMNTEFGAGLRAGTRQSGTVGFLASIPYGMEAEFRYAVDGSGRTGAAKAYAPCLVPVQDAGTTPPTVSGLRVTASSGPVEAGDTVRVAWSAASTTGLWESGVVVSGAFEGLRRMNAAQLKQGTFTAEFVVPRSALLGEPVRVQVYARDLMVRPSAVAAEAVGPVTDATAPVLLAVSTTGNYGDILRGQYQAGSGVGVHLWAQDRGRLAWIVYEVGTAAGTTRDSVALDTIPSQVIGLRTPATLSGEASLRLYVRDAAGNRSRTVQSAPGAVRFYPSLPAQSRETTVPFQPSDHVVDVARGRVAVSALREQRVNVYALQGLTQVASVPLPGNPSQLHVGPDGQVVALLPQLRSLAVIDVAGQRVSRTVVFNTVALDSIYGFGITPGGRALLLARRGGGGATIVLEYDFATGAQRVRTDAPAVPYAAAGVASSLDGTRMLLGAGCVYRADTDTFAPCAAMWTGNDYYGGRFVGSGTGAYWANPSRTFDGSLRLLREQGASALSADDRHAYLAEFQSIVRTRASDGVIENALQTFLRGPTRATPDGRMLVSLEMAGVTNNQYHLRVTDLP